MGKTRMTERKLERLIMKYWCDCIDKSMEGDFAVNDLLEKFVRKCKAPYYSDDLDWTVENLTKEQKRALYQEMLDSGILEG